MKRRQAITAAVGFSLSLAGCSGSQSRDGDIDLNIFNQAAEPYTIEIGFFGDGSSEETARAYDTALDIESGGQQTSEDIVEAKRYLVRYDVYEDNSRLTDQDHIHYIPSGDETESLTLDIQETGTVTRR